MKNVLTTYAESKGRDYITPEDVIDVRRQGNPAHVVRLAVLQVLADITPFGAEDAPLCAFHACLSDEDAALFWSSEDKS